MVKRPLATIAAIGAVLATLGVFLPWCFVTVTPGGGSEQTYTHNGLQCVNHGTIVLPLVGCAALLTLVVASVPSTRLPIRSRYLLGLAAILLIVGFGVTLADFTRETVNCALRGKGPTLDSGHGAGIMVVLLCSIGAGVTALFGLITRAAPEA